MVELFLDFKLYSRMDQYQGYPSLEATGTIFRCRSHADIGTCGAIGNGFDLSNYSSVANYILLGPGGNGYIDGNFNISTPSITINGNTIGKPYLSVYLSANQTGMTTATPTKIQYNTVEIDSGGYFDNKTHYRYTPLIAGKYDCTNTVTAKALGSGTGTYAAFLYKNGNVIKAANRTTATTGSHSFTNVAHGLVTMNGSTDYIEGWGEVTGTSITGFLTGTPAGALTHLECSYVGP